jgi:hypothetical protein
MGFFVTLSKNDIQNNSILICAECCYAECRIILILMLNVTKCCLTNCGYAECHHAECRGDRSLPKSKASTVGYAWKANQRELRA